MHDNSNKFQSFIFGDFNCPNVSWDDLSSHSVHQVNPDLAKFIDTHFLTQYVHEKTRKNNILDLFFSNDPHFVQHVKVTDINISDHYLIHIFTSFFQNLKSDSVKELPTLNQEHGINFSKLNLNTADFRKINLEFSQVNWNALITENSIENFPDIFHDIVYNILIKHTKLHNDKRTKTHFRRKEK